MGPVTLSFDVTESLPGDISDGCRIAIAAWQTFSVDGGLDQRTGPDFMDAFFGKDVMDQIRAGKAVERP